MYLKTCFLCTCVFISYVCGQYLNIPEGSSCNFKDAIGKCVLIYKCLSAMFDIDRQMNPPICGFDGDVPLICCTDCDLVNDTRNVLFNPNLGFLQLNGHTAHDQCLTHIDQLSYKCKENTTSLRTSILNKDKRCYNHVSKTISDKGDTVGSVYPHMAMLGYGEEWQSAQWLCSGSVISNKFVLTTAHCAIYRKVGAVKYLGVGLTHRSDSPGLWQRYRVSRFIAHPEFQPTSIYHDIALLETGTPIIFSEKVMPACLTPPTPPLGSDLVEADDMAIYSSWYAVGKMKGLDVLVTIPLEKFSEQDCLKEFPPHKLIAEGYNHTTQMCYGRLDVVIDKCEGDVGGPLQYEPFCTSAVLGISLMNRACGMSTRANLFTRVSYYLPWIESHVWP